MDLYPLIVFLHVTSAVAVIGISGVAAPVLHHRLRRSTAVASVRPLVQLARTLAVVERNAGILTLIAGVTLTVMGRWWTSAWIPIALIVIVSSALLAAKVIDPALERIELACPAGPADDIPSSLSAAIWSPRLVRGERHAVANDVLIVFLMTTKPGLVAALAAVVLAHAVAAASGTAVLSAKARHKAVTT